MPVRAARCHHNRQQNPTHTSRLQRPRVSHGGRLVLQDRHSVPSPSGKATVCKTVIPQFKSGWHLQTLQAVRANAKTVLALFALAACGPAPAPAAPPPPPAAKSFVAVPVGSDDFPEAAKLATDLLGRARLGNMNE